jgi:2-dehydro-3-deoxygluconokinase
MKKVVGFGEVMLRMSPPGYLKLIQSDTFQTNYTGAEANTCVSLSCFGLDTEFVTKLPDNDISQCAVATLKKFGVGTNHITYGGDRLGCYFLEKGASQRPSKIVYDRKYSAISMAERSDFDWERIFENARAFHFSGITAALGKNLSDVCMDACRTAKRHGVRVFCDLNYRKNLWTPEQARETMSALVPFVDVLIGNEEDSEKVLGIKPKNSDVTSGKLDHDDYEDVARQIVERFGCEKVAFTLRTSVSASDNKWAGILYESGRAYFSREYAMHIVDRVGGGDSFSAGLIYSVLNDFDPQKTLDFAVAASCLKHSIEFDFNLSTVEDVESLINGDGSGRVQR